MPIFYYYAIALLFIDKLSFVLQLPNIYLQSTFDQLSNEFLSFSELIFKVYQIFFINLIIIIFIYY